MVSYHFDIATKIVEKPGFPRVASKRDNTGTVRLLDGKPIPGNETPIALQRQFV